jgi:hypothetical protein
VGQRENSQGAILIHEVEHQQRRRLGIDRHRLELRFTFVNAPSVSAKTTLTRSDMIKF